MIKKTQTLIGAIVLICVLVFGIAIVLSLGQRRMQFSGAAARPVVTHTPLPPLPVATFYLPRYETPTSPPPMPMQMPAPVVTLEPYPPTDDVGTPLPGTQVAPMPTLDPTTASEQATALAITPTPFPTRFHVTPDTSWRRYVDPNLGFAFVYPNNWFVSAYTFPDYKFDTGYSMSLRNFDNVFKSYGEYEKGEIKIEIVVFPDKAKPLAITSLASQVVHDAKQASRNVTELMETPIAGNRGVRWVEQGESIPQGIVSYLFRDAIQGRVYMVYAGPADSDQINVLDRIVSSLEINSGSIK